MTPDQVLAEGVGVARADVVALTDRDPPADEVREVLARTGAQALHTGDAAAVAELLTHHARAPRPRGVGRGRRRDRAGGEGAAGDDPFTAPGELDGAAKAGVREAKLVLQDGAADAAGPQDLEGEAQRVVFDRRALLGRRHGVQAGGALGREVRAAQLREGGGVLGAERAEAAVAGGTVAAGAGSTGAHG